MDGCVFCVGHERAGTFLEAEQSRPLVCDAKDPESCVEFCSTLTPDCALPWIQGPGCVFDSELNFRRALFNRDASDRPEVVLYGRAIDDAGKRLEGARVRTWLSRGNELTPLGDEVSGKDGAFRLRLRVGAWSYALRISHPGRATEIIDKLAPDKLDRIPNVPRLVRMQPEYVIRGRITDEATGAPVADADVQALRSAEDVIDAGLARSTEDGSFALGGLTSRRYFLRVSKFGWRAATSKVQVTVSLPRVNVKLVRANVIRGVVKRADGEPEPNTTVAAVLSGVAGTPTLPYIWTSDAGGQFAQDHFAAGTYYLWARRGDLLAYPPEKIDLAQNQEVEVTLWLKHEGARVSGRVKAREGYRLSAECRAVLLSRSPLAFPRPAVGELDEQGRFVVAGVLPGRYEISIRSGARTLSIVDGPRNVEVPIEPDSAVLLREAIVVRPQIVE